MSGADVTVQAFGFSHPGHDSSIKPVKRGPDTPLEWHRKLCPAPKGNCSGCAPAPKST